MNNYRSPMDHPDDDRSSSPKRKKIRQKYAPKACVSCRRSKLKCTGENPCQRCTDNGKRCFYSEDQTAAEVLQNLSRPTTNPGPQPPFGNGNNNNGNGNSNAASRQYLMPHNDAAERRASDTGNTALTMEERMARIEKMMEALIHERGLVFTPSGSIEREQSIGFRSETAFSMPLLDPIHPALDHLAQQSPEQMQHSSLPDAPDMGADAPVFIRVGDQSVPFPGPGSFQQYVAYFFGDVHLRHPCVDEANFNVRVQQIVTNGITGPSDVNFLALCYAIFACCDAITELTPPPISIESTKPPGWQWAQLAEAIIDKTSFHEADNDMAMIQYLLFQALYLTYADMPARAYAASHVACTVALQQNLHQQSTWVEGDPVQMYWWMCLFWNIYLSDRSISISCGRPASLHLEDLNVDMPDAFCEQAQLTTQPHENDQRYVANLYLRYEFQSAQLATTLSSQIRIAPDTSEVQSLLATIMHSSEPRVSDALGLLPSSQHMSNPVMKTFMTLKRFTLPLIVGRRAMTPSAYSSSIVQAFIAFSSDALENVRNCRNDTNFPPSCRHLLTSILAGMLLVSGTILLQDLTALKSGQLDSQYNDAIEQFVDVAAILSSLAQELPYARRVQEDFLDLISVVRRIADNRYAIPRAQRSAASPEVYTCGLIPEDIIESFPYQVMSPPLQSHSRREGVRRVSGVLWLF